MPLDGMVGGGQAAAKLVELVALLNAGMKSKRAQVPGPLSVDVQMGPPYLNSATPNSSRVIALGDESCRLRLGQAIRYADFSVFPGASPCRLILRHWL
jgi:hypothetical protein